MPTENNVKFCENPTVLEDPDRYVTVRVRVPEIVKSWRLSLFSFEWLKPDGTIKSKEELSSPEQGKRADFEKMLHEKKPVPMPILGIGMSDNVEIGAGRAEFLTLAAMGIQTLPVHIPKSCKSDFKAFCVDVESPE